MLSFSSFSITLLTDVIFGNILTIQCVGCGVVVSRLSLFSVSILYLLFFMRSAMNTLSNTRTLLLVEIY